MLINKSSRVQIDSAFPQSVSSYGVLGRELSHTLVNNGHEHVIVSSFMGGHEPRFDGALRVYPQRQTTAMGIVSSTNAQVRFNKENPAVNISIINPRILDAKVFSQFNNWIAWTPSETDEMMPSDINVLKNADAIWGMSKFVTESIKRAMPDNRNIYYMPCMINDDYKPMWATTGRHAMAHLSINALHIGKNLKAGSVEQKESFVKYADLANAFIFIMVGANTKDPSRKGFYEAIEAFALTLKEIPNAYLYLHTSNNNGEEWWQYARDLGVAHRVLSPLPEMYDDNSYRCADLALLMSACDAYVSTSYGEGDNLGCKEAQACGVPIIVPDHTAFTEHCHPDLLIPTNSSWMRVAPNHECKKWWGNIDVKATARKWIKFAKLTQDKRDKYKDMAQAYGQSFKGNVIYPKHIEPFFLEREFKDFPSEQKDIRKLQDEWVRVGLIDK